MTLFNIYPEKILCAIFVILLLNGYVSARSFYNAVGGGVGSEFNVDEIAEGAYSFRYKTPENTQRGENGYLDDEGNLVVDGYYSYIDPDGKLQNVSYFADKDGYRISEIPKGYVPKFDPNVEASLLAG